MFVFCPGAGAWRLRLRLRLREPRRFPQVCVQLTGTQCVSVSTFLRARLSSPNADTRSSFTITRSKRWLYWFSISWAARIISWKSSSWSTNEREEKNTTIWIKWYSERNAAQVDTDLLLVLKFPVVTHAVNEQSSWSELASPHCQRYVYLINPRWSKLGLHVALQLIRKVTVLSIFVNDLPVLRASKFLRLINFTFIHEHLLRWTKRK